MVYTVCSGLQSKGETIFQKISGSLNSFLLLALSTCKGNVYAVTPEKHIFRKFVLL